MRNALLILGVTALFLPLNAQTLDTSTLVGKWKLSSQSQFQGRLPQPADGTLVISEATPAHFKWRISVVYMKNGTGVSYDSAFDGDMSGKPYDYQCPGQRQRAKVSYVENGSSLEGNMVYANGDMQHEVLTLSADGNTITSQCTFSSSTTKKSWTEVWKRVPDKKHK